MWWTIAALAGGRVTVTTLPDGSEQTCTGKGKTKQCVTVTTGHHGELRCIKTSTSSGCRGEYANKLWRAFTLTGDETLFPEPLPCERVPIDPTSPAHAAARGTDEWIPGQPSPQTAVCLPGMTRPNELRDLTDEVDVGWWLSPRRIENASLAEVGSTEPYTAYTFGPFVVLYNQSTDQHQWLGAVDAPLPHAEFVGSSLRIERGGEVQIVSLEIDRDGDGSTDKDWREPSKYGEIHCRVDGATQQRACVEHRKDGAFRVTSRSHGDTSAVLPGMLPCSVEASAEKPTPAVALLQGVRATAWTDGLPQPQTPACISHDGWTHVIGTDGAPAVLPQTSDEPGRYEVWGLGEAYAIVDTQRGRHIWWVTVTGAPVESFAQQEDTLTLTLHSGAQRTIVVPTFEPTDPSTEHPR